MGAADSALLRWLDGKIHIRATEVAIPAQLREPTTEDGLKKAKALAKIYASNITTVPFVTIECKWHAESIQHD